MNFVIWYKRLVFLTFSFFLSILLVIFLYSYNQSKIIIYKQKPTIIFGNINSNIEVILFEDLNCEECKDFFLHIFPLIKKNYLDT